MEGKDFLPYMLKHEDESKAMTDNIFRETSRPMITAGAETTIAMLSMVAYCLLKYPHATK
jgi:cytochrome P450